MGGMHGARTCLFLFSLPPLQNFPVPLHTLARGAPRPESWMISFTTPLM
jgi:hypothetical protein